MQDPPTAPPQVPPDEMLALIRSIRRIVRASDLGSRSLQKSSGLTAPQLAVLAAIGREGEISTGGIAARVDLSAATVVTILDNLERRGLVSRRRSGDDRRVVLTRMTDAGTALLARAHAPFGEPFAREIARLPAERRQQLIENLVALADLMSAPVGAQEQPIQSRSD
jgi:DNA-binding MarR family transcriptional regulator